MKKLIILSLFILEITANPTPRRFVSTAERVTGHGYPLEEHKVQTSDGYVLTMFRIPYSPTLNNKYETNKKVVFLMHGLLSSSDSWVLNGPNDAMAFMMADAGYDVWMGNARGNVYSKKHASISPLLPSFWDFDWHEIALYDLPAMIDYTLYQTGQDGIHYIGHSQGTTVFMVLLSTIPRYNEKIKTSHLLAPVGFMNNMQSPLAKIAAPFLGHPSLLAELIGSSEFMPSNKLITMLGPEICQEKSPFIPMCSNILFLIGGWDSSHFNYTLMEDTMETHPAGSSTGQLIHYLQEYESGFFRNYDHGRIRNKKIYGTKVAPDYFVQNIHPSTPINFFYSDNDYFSAVEDVHRMADILGKHVKLFRVSYTDYNHLDFLWAIDIKDVINACVVDLVNEYENRPFKGNLCKYFI
ncbi:lipase 3-like [Lucilia sericata]|uniref:lipase 3-like n=1 Tax=Lucilia sericata TaxID=13632 RepID=UPI0018A85175|nr:lipase 3-like [Lucilia sericata]